MAYRESYQAFDPDLDRRIDLLHYRRDLILTEMVDEMDAANMEEEFEALYKVWMAPCEKLLDLTHMGLSREESSAKALVKWLKEVDEELAEKLAVYEKLSHELAEAEAPYTKILQDLITQLRATRHDYGMPNRSFDSLRRRKFCH